MICKEIEVLSDSALKDGKFSVDDLSTGTFPTFNFEFAIRQTKPYGRNGYDISAYI